MSTTNSPNMSLPVPTAGTETGPAYALDINSCLSLIDTHDHSPGRGVQITPPGININAALSINNQNLTAINSALFTAQTVATSSLQAISVAPGSESPPVQDLWYTDSNGTQIQITNNGQLAAVPTSVVGISYAAGTFFFKQTPDTSTAPANLDAGSVIIRPNVALTSLGVVLSPPASIATQYPIQLPPLPGANSFMTLDNSGNMATAGAVANGITKANLAVGAFGVQAVSTVTGSYTVLSSDDTILANAAGGFVIVNLPTAIGISGRIYTIKKIDSTFNSIVITPVLTQTLDGANSIGLFTQYESVQIMSDGTNWQVLEHTIPTNLTAYTPTFSASFGSPVTNIRYFWKRQGDQLIVTGSHTNGILGASQGSISLPTGLTIDINKLGINTNNISNPGQLIGQFISSGGVAGPIAPLVTAPATTVSSIYVGGLYSGNNMLVPTNNLAAIVGNNSVPSSCTFSVPISGWRG